jgi:hypothetical protein
MWDECVRYTINHDGSWRIDSATSYYNTKYTLTDLQLIWNKSFIQKGLSRQKIAGNEDEELDIAVNLTQSIFTTEFWAVERGSTWEIKTTARA